MKGKLNNYLLKLFSLVLAFILVFPTEIFAMAMDDKASTYNASTSIMGLATQTQNPEENSTESTDEKQTLIKSEISTDETNEYLIEKSATLSKTTGQIDYKILVKSKKSDDKDKNQTAIFAITQNTELKDLRVEKVQELSADGTEKDAEYTQNTASLFTPQDNQRTFGITTTSAENAMVYYLSAKLSDEALVDIDKKSPNMDLEFAIKKLENIYQSRYALEIAKPQENDIIIDHNGNLKNQEESLKEITDNTHQYKAIYEESQGLFANTPAQITWTDYISNKDDKEFTYNIDLDENQDTTNSQIKIEYYQASEKGYILNEEFTKTLDFTNSLNLQIPQGYIAKVELNTRPKDKTNAKEYVFNGIKIPNPTYTEEKTQPTEEQTSDDADSLPADTSKEENSQNQKADETQTTEESNTESTTSNLSAIELNKDAYISDLKENNKLTTNLEKATKQIALSLESYNKEEINWDDFKASIQTIAEAQNIDSTQTQEILSSLIAGLNEDKYKVASIDTKKASAFDTANSDQENDNTLATEEGTELPKDNLSEEEIKSLIKEEFTKEKSGQITKEELETSLATIREENNISNEYFFNILSDLYQNGEIANDGEDNIATIDTDKTKEEALAEKLAEENLSTEDFIAFLQSYAKTYDIKEDGLKDILEANQDEVSKVIGEFTIDEIVGAAYLDGLNPQVFADTTNTSLKFITELEYFTETLTRATNEEKLFEIVKNNFTKDDTNSSDQLIRSNYVGWKINIPGDDESGMDIKEIKKADYDYQNLNFSIYAPAGQSLKDYKVVVEDGNGGTTSYSGSMTEKKGDHYVYRFPIPKANLSEDGYNIYVVAKAAKKRQNYAIGLKISPDNNYVLSFKNKFEEAFNEFAKNNPLLIKWKDTSDANPYRNGIELLDTRMVYLEPNGWQDLFPYNGFRSVDYNDNITDTDLMKNTVSMFGNIDKEGDITWTISETFPAEKLENKNTVGLDAYSAKSDSGNLGNPSVQILIPNNNGGYDARKLGNININELQNQIGNRPGTIVNYTYKDTAKNKEEFTTLSLDSGKSASIAYRPVLERDLGDIVDQTGLEYLHKVQTHNDGPGYEVALANDQAHTLTAFIPRKPSANPRYNDPAFKDTGVVVFCLNPGKPEPTRQYKFNGTITKGEWSTAKKDWVNNGKALASLATANEAKASPLYKKNGNVVNDTFYASLYEYVLRLYWYGQELAEEYQLDEQSYYKIIQYNLYYWIAGENYAESFRNGGGYNPNYFSSAEYSYAQGLKNRISQGKDWKKVNYDEDIEIYYYGHDKSRSYQNTITGDTKRKSKKGSVTVNKIDQDGKKLPGAYFQLLDEKKTPIKTLVTDANGVAVFEDLEYGTYYIKEVQGPKGYQYSDQQTKVEVSEEKAHVTFNYTNTKNEIEFRKVNEKGLAMEGVVFELRRNGRPVSDQDKTSDKNGKFSWKELTPGNYEVVEKDISKYPEYSENEGRVVASFRVDENNKIQDKKIYYPNGSSTTDIKNEKNEGKPIGIEFTKVDLNTGKVLEGAEFVLEYKKPDSSIFRELPGSRRKSNSEGKLVWNDLVDGEYRVIETKAPEGNYDTELNLGEKATFTIVKNQNGYYEIKNVTPENKEITNKEKPEEPKEHFGEFEFTKLDSEDKKPLQGVEFTLTSEGQVGPEKDKFDYKVSKTTDAEGKIAYTKLYPGTYTLKETKQLPGYKENTKTWKVVVDSQGETKVQAEGGNYKIETSGEESYTDSYVSLKASIKETDTEGVLVYTMTVKPIRQIAAIRIHPNSGLIKGDLTSSGTAYISKLEVGKEKKFSKTFSIKDIDNIEKNKFIDPINQVMILEDNEGNLRTASISPKFKVVEESGPLTITNVKEKPEPANLTIKKVDSQTKEGLEGAKFKLYTSENDAKIDNYSIDEAVTNEHGYAVFGSPEIMPNTTYYVKEIAAPDGYKITSEITRVTSSKTADNKINAEIPNDKNNARFELYKKGIDGEYLAGVKFKLTNKTTNKSVELETDGNGYLAYDKLKPKTSYELEEIKSAQGYTRNEAKATITVDASGKVSVNTNELAEAKEGENPGLVLVATNIKQASIDFVKQDGANKKALYGAEFVLYKGDKEVKNSLTSSDKEGKFGFDNLEDGSYTVYETASPKGYPYLEEKLIVATFTVKDGKVTELKTYQQYDEETIENFDPNEAYPIYNKINEIKFIKKNKDSDALKGAKFKLDRVWDSYDENGKIQSHRDTVLEDIKTLEDGIISLSATKAGRYQLVETQAPEGYKRINTNNAAGGQIVAEFTVERATLDIKNVLVGNTYIQDMKDYTGDLEIVNKKDVKGKLQVNKVEKDGGSIKPLSGARFLLKDLESGQYVKTDGTFTTNSGAALTNGDATVNYQNLPVGEYELREFKSPDGYIRTINTWKIEVNDDGKTTISENPKLDNDVKATITEETSTTPANLQLENKSNEIEFTKKDSKTGDALEGVYFEIWWDQQANRTSDNNLYKNYVKIKNSNGSTTFTTGADGKIKLTNLKTGHYKIYETKMREGYYAANKPIDNEPIKEATGEFVKEFFVDIDGDIKKNEHGVVDADNENLITTIENTPYTGKFRVQKVGEDGVEKLEGAEFELYKVIGENVDKENPIKAKQVITQDEQVLTGLVEFADLENGEYLLEETKAPKGYGISNTTWNISVNDGKVNITSTNGSADFTRTDDTITLNVINKKASYPSTGGAGTFIGFALIGTAVMLAGIAYFAIYQNDKNRRRSDRYGR